MKFNQTAFDMIKPMPPFTRPMRDANRSGIKSQTRRVAKPAYWPVFEASAKVNRGVVEMEMLDYDINSPYGHKSDLRYMREPLNLDFNSGFAYYADDDKQVFHLLTGEPVKWKWKVDTLSGMYMPKFAARTFKRYDFIRAEKLNQISRADAIAEGCPIPTEYLSRALWPEEQYEVLWNSLNAKRGYPWESNPWVWVIGYHDELAQILGEINRDDYHHSSHMEHVVETEN